MDEFLDYLGNKIQLSFDEDFGEEAHHVLVICEYQDGWLLTEHKERGLEFPGGKKEIGESLEEAARREVFEETGASLSLLKKIGTYKIFGRVRPVVKAIYWGVADTLTHKSDYLETNGPIRLSKDLMNKRFEQQFSFIMKDKVVERSLEKIAILKEKTAAQSRYL